MTNKEELKNLAEINTEAVSDDSDNSYEPVDFYDKEINKYKKTLKRDKDTAFKRYGFTVFHSLDDYEKIELKEELGFEAVDEQDFYNIATTAAVKGDYEKAKKFFEKALKSKKDFPNASFNLALTYAKLNDNKKAVDLLKDYLKNVEDPFEKEEVEEFISELQNS